MQPRGGGGTARSSAQYYPAPIVQFRGRGRRGGSGSNFQGSRRSFYRALRQSSNQPFESRNSFVLRRGGGERRGAGGRPLSSGVTVVRRSQGVFMSDSPSQGGRKVNRNRAIRKRALIPNARFVNTSLARRGEYPTIVRPVRGTPVGWIPSRETSMLKKIKIVAELDRLPPPLSAQQGIRGGRGPTATSASITLNERFRV